MPQNTDTNVGKLEGLLKDYLQKKTAYAVMLTASWGAGKTYYLREVFFNKLEETGYKGIIVSLFGVKTVDDIKDRIFMELYPFWDNKHTKAAGSFIKMILKSIDITKIIAKDGLVSSTVDNVNTAGKEVAKFKFDFIDLGKLLICFDDLERVDNSLLSENQILGFINSLVEDDNIKIIVVANKDKIGSEKFKTVMEKTIGHIIYFHQEFPATFQHFLEKRPDSTTRYLEHLRNNEDLIYERLLLENGENINYRTLDYFLTYYDAICHFILKPFDIKELNDLREDLLLEILNFCLMVCVEYRKGEIDFKDKKDLDNGTQQAILSYLRTREEEPKGYAEQTIDKYYKAKTGYHYYESLYNYFTGGDFFDEEKFLAEICVRFNVSNEVISEPYKLFNKLSSPNVAKLSDKEYVDDVRQLREYALKGEYKMTYYITLFYYIMRSGNVLNVKERALVDQFKQVIRKMKSTHVYISYIENHIRLEKSSPYYEYYAEVKAVMLGVNEYAKRSQETLKRKEFEKNFQTNYNQFHRDLAKSLSEHNYDLPLSAIDPAIFLKVFKKADNSQKYEMLNLFRISFYHKYHNPSVYDSAFLAELKRMLDKIFEKTTPKNISGSLLADLKYEVTEMIKS